MSDLGCPKCGSKTIQTRTVKSEDNRFVKRYYRCDKCQFTFNTCERSQVKITLYDRDHFIEDICSKIQLEFSSRNDGMRLNRENYFQALGYDTTNLDKVIESALERDDFYAIVREVFLQSLDRFEVIETIPIQMQSFMWDMILDNYQLKGLPREEVLAMNIHWPDSKSPYIVDPDNPPVFHLPKKTTVENNAKYLNINDLRKEAFPKKRSLERKPLKIKKM